MNTADLAVIAVTTLGLADGYWHHRFRMGLAPRVRVVNPQKAPTEDSAAKDGLPSIAAARRTG